MVLPFDQRDGVIWLDGRLVPWRDATTHVLNHGLHYGGAVFEGERAYDGVVFRSSDHGRRFRRSAELLDFAVPYTVEALDAAKAEVVAANGVPDVYVRPVAWRGSDMMGVGAPDARVHVAIAAWAWPSMQAEKRDGIRIDIADYRRPDPRTAPSAAKAAGLYMICTLSRHRAARNGYTDALMLDWQGRVAECTSSNVFFVRDGALHTPIADCFLDGLTRQTVIALAERAGIAVAERRIAPDELRSFDECFICGTAAEIVPVREIGPFRFTPGIVTERLMGGYAEEVRRRVPGSTSPRSASNPASAEKRPAVVDRA